MVGLADSAAQKSNKKKKQQKCPDMLLCACFFGSDLHGTITDRTCDFVSVVFVDFTRNARGDEPDTVSMAGRNK